MKTNDTVSLYIELMIEKNLIESGDRIPSVINVNQNAIPSVPFDPTPSKVTIEWDCNSEKGKVYNKV